MIRRVSLLAGIGALLLIGLTASPASAATSGQDINDLRSNNGGGTLHIRLTWLDGSLQVSDSSTNYLRDLASDGSGPYAHIIGGGSGAGGPIYIHNTAGAGTNVRVHGFIFGTMPYVDAWTCQGGNADGIGATYCHGRRYFNQNISPGKGSEALRENTIPY